MGQTGFTAGLLLLGCGGWNGRVLDLTEATAAQAYRKELCENGLR